MRIGHFSDLHGQPWAGVGGDPPDLWVSTGDYFPNLRYPPQHESEARYQAEWFRRGAPATVARLRGRPLLVVAGNHDYADLAALVTETGGTALTVPPEGRDFMGVRWAGVRQIPFIHGTWNGEVMEADLARIMRRVLAADPTVLLTHSPPAGMVDGGLGSLAIANALLYLPHRIATVLCGHLHEARGEVEINGMRVINSATVTRYLSI